MMTSQQIQWRMAAIFKTILSLQLSRRRSDFDKVWCTDADFDYKNEYGPKVKIFQI